MLASSGRMRIHRFQAHTKSAAVKKVQKIKKSIRKKVLNRTSYFDLILCTRIIIGNAFLNDLFQQILSTKTTFPSIKSISDLRSKVPDIDIDSNICPVCKKVFSNKPTALKHFKVVHRKEERVKCPHSQCFTRCSTVHNLRTHFANAHPKATLPKEFGPSRVVKRVFLVHSTNKSDNNHSNIPNFRLKNEALKRKMNHSRTH